MSQFDQTTERKAAEDTGGPGCCMDSFHQGRNSTKKSLEILARFVEELDGEYMDCSEIIAAVKERGDWPLGGA